MSNSFIKIEKISKFYPLKKKEVKKALRSASFEIKEGEVFGLLGVNGAGKTTLVSILSTLHPPTSGDILWQGQSIYKNLLAYRQKVGFCPQKINVQKKLTIEENLLFAGRCYGLSKIKAEERKEYLLDKFNLQEYAHFQTDALSGGYQQRFSIAKALMHEPKLVILDEPTVGLDPHIRRQLWEVIEELRSENISVLLTTHYLDEAEELSDRVGLIHAGEIRTIDTPDNLKKRHNKNNLEEVFLKFVDDPNAQIFNSTDNNPTDENA